MTIKGYATAALFAVAVAAAFGWYRTEIARARAQGRIEVLTVQVDQQADEYRTFREAVADRDSVRAREMAQLTERADSLDTALVITRRESQRTVAELDGLLATIPDSVSRAVNEAITALQRENQTCTLAFRNCLEMLSVEMERAGDYRRQIIRADSLVLAQRRVIEQLEDMGQRSTLLPWAIAGAAVVIAGAVVVF